MRGGGLISGSLRYMNKYEIQEMPDCSRSKIKPQYTHNRVRVKGLLFSACSVGVPMRPYAPLGATRTE